MRYALLGLQVVRLKGGDPFIFGRGGEELEALRDAGIAVEIVPGITAALGAAASAQVPLTHREISSALVLVTGSSKREDHITNWPDRLPRNATVAVYMPGDLETLGEHEVGETVTAQNATVLLQAKDQGEAMAIPIQVTLLR